MQAASQVGEPLEQSGDSMWRRNVLHAGSRVKEVVVYVKGLEELDFTGFICGMDEDWLQLCLTKDQSLILIEGDSILAMHLTPNTLSAYQRDKVLSEAESSRIRKMVNPFRNVCNAVLEGEGQDASPFPVLVPGTTRFVPESSTPAQEEEGYVHNREESATRP